MLGNINCCHVAIAGLIGWLISSTIQHIQTAKIKTKAIELELRTKELEKKNGKEQAQINELREELAQLKKTPDHAK